MEILHAFAMAARAAGEISLRQQGKSPIAVSKGEAHDFATQVDLDAGAVIEQELRERLPNLPIVSEENRAGLPEDQFRAQRLVVLHKGTYLVVDDLDATFVYKSSVVIEGQATGGENYGHIIGLIRDGAVTHCLMYLPRLAVTITAEKGRGCFVNNLPHHLPAGKKAANSLFYLIRHQDIPGSFDELISHIVYGLRPGGCVCLNSNIGGISRVVLGEYGAFVGAGKIWDYPGLLAVQEAGGLIASTDGQPLNWSRIPQVVVAAASAEIGEAILTITMQYPGYQNNFWENPKFQS